MSQPAVVFDKVWKKFQRGERHDSLRDLIPSVTRRLFARTPASDLQDQEFWAVRDVSFEVKPGHALGIIGPNGAGKSTVLKLLTRILRPTRGTCLVRGRAGALIEVASGFHPDLTGRENIYLQGAIMGMTRVEISRKLEEIVEFSGTSEFLETPVKRYSSGMNARLGFAIAAHMDPEVLLIDEVLAVGDLAFQERCYQRMNAYKRKGVAIVFVSHNLSAVAALCDDVAVLASGQLLTIAPPQEAFDAYASHTSRAPDAALQAGSGTLTITNERGEPVSRVAAGEELIVRALLQMPATEGTVSSGLRIRRVETGEMTYLTTSPSVGCPAVPVPTTSLLEVEWRFKANLSRGHYSVEVAMIEVAKREEIMSLTAPQFLVHESESEVGSTYLQARCSVVPMPAEEARTLAVQGPPQ